MNLDLCSNSSSTRFALLLLVALSTCSVATAQVPNTFQAGQVARASEVNENFAAVDGAVSALKSDVEDLQAGADDLQEQIAWADERLQEIDRAKTAAE